MIRLLRFYNFTFAMTHESKNTWDDIHARIKHIAHVIIVQPDQEVGKMYYTWYILLSQILYLYAVEFIN